MVLPWFIEIPVLNVNSVDHDQTLRSVASDLDLLCLSIALFAGNRWVKL